MGPTLTTRRPDLIGIWPVGTTESKSPSRGGSVRGLAPLGCISRPKPRPDQVWHDRVKGALPAIPRSRRSNAEPPVLTSEAERRSALAHADVGPLSIAPCVNHLLLAPARALKCGTVLRPSPIGRRPP